ncbi:portal protein [Acidovorax phage ACF1]|nr:portal protein [Acidovorax phage ACF1]
MVTLSKNGKRIGRPPKAQPAPPSSPAPVAAAASGGRLRNRYDAAGMGKRLAGWIPPSSGPNTATAGLQTIRNRARDSGRNDWAAKSVTQKWASNLIGIAITPRFKRIASKTRKAEITDLYNDFVKKADADYVLDLYGMQTLAVKAWCESGEVFARRRNRFPDEDLPVAMQVQLLEADMCPIFDADTWKGLPVNNVIRSGIELDRRGRRVAYWFYKQHPGDKALGSFTTTGDELVRVAASEVIHMFEPERPGQLRGVPQIASVLTKLRNVADYEDATLERQKIANLFVAFIKRTLPALDPNDPLYGALTGMPYETDGADPTPLVPLKPGLFQELDDGQDVQFSNPPEAGTNYSDYMRTSHLGTAAGAGLPYELMSGDIREISDRTLRVVINDFRRFAEQRQWQIVIPMFCQRVIEWFVDAAVLAGKISAAEADDARRVEHAPHGWEYIHPVQDVQGKVLEMDNGIRSRSGVIGARGEDPELVDDERAKDLQREKDLGLYVDPAASAGAAQADQQQDADEDGIDDQEYSAPPTASAKERRDLHLAMLARLEAETDAMRAAAAKARREPPVPAVDPAEEARQRVTNRILDMLDESDGGQQ